MIFVLNELAVLYRNSCGNMGIRCFVFLCVLVFYLCFFVFVIVHCCFSVLFSSCVSVVLRSYATRLFLVFLFCCFSSFVCSFLLFVLSFFFLFSFFMLLFHKICTRDRSVRRHLTPPGSEERGPEALLPHPCSNILVPGQTSSLHGRERNVKTAREQLCCAAPKSQQRLRC